MAAADVSGSRELTQLTRERRPGSEGLCVARGRQAVAQDREGCNLSKPWFVHCAIVVGRRVGCVRGARAYARG